MPNQDVRWQQRLQNFKKAFEQLDEFISKENLNKLEEQGLIQCFEYNFELAWNTIKDFYQSQGETGIQGSRDSFRLAFQRGLVADGHLWMEMIKSRILTAHTYNEDTANLVINDIKGRYYCAFLELIKVLESKK